MIARQQKQIEVLMAGLQKVNNQLEMARPAPRVVANISLTGKTKTPMVRC